MRQIKNVFMMVLVGLLLTACRSNNIVLFTSDGCSSFPDGTLKQKDLWLTCCSAHDRAYWQGGTYDDRLQSDKALQACVQKVGEKEIALLMLAGVRVGGSPYLPTSFRWGYGWPYPRGYGELTAHELELVQQMEQEVEQGVEPSQ
ncbi:MAG: hypothetical protein KUG79_06735 [Pseudomonadales bacterium]|nr:hypothetical protein [Pseudomonadales bacterium]